MLPLWLLVTISRAGSFVDSSDRGGPTTQSLLATAQARCEFDRRRPADHNHLVVRSIGHLALILALAPWMVCSVAVPPEHVHEADAHHAHSVTHRHIESHDQNQTEIEPGDG